MAQNVYFCLPRIQYKKQKDYNHEILSQLSGSYTTLNVFFCCLCPLLTSRKIPNQHLVQINVPGLFLQSLGHPLELQNGPSVVVVKVHCLLKWWRHLHYQLKY